MRSTLVGRLNTDNSLVGAGNTITGHNQLVGTFGNRGIVTGEVGTAYNPTYAIVTEAGAQITLYINSSNYQFYAELKDKNGNHIANSNIIDLPLESMVVNGSYDADTKEVVLTLDNGNEVRFSVADLVEGLVSTEQLNTILGDYVQFTDYATADTGGVVKISNTYATALNNGTLRAQNKIYTEYQGMDGSAFIGKTTLENVITGKELTNKTYVDNADAVFNNDLFGANEISGTGESLTLNGTANAPIDINLKGNTYQYSTSGKNYLPITLPETTTQNGITLKYDSETGWITISGKATANVSILWQFSNVTMPSTTYIQYENDFSTSNAQIGYMNGSTIVSSLTFGGLNRIYDRSSELGGQTINQCYFYVANGTTINGKCRPMITQYSTIQEWEKFTGGNPAPSPDYPQPIQVVSGDNSIKVEGKQKFNKNETPMYQSNADMVTILDTGLKITDKGSSSANRYVNYNLFDMTGKEGKVVRIKTTSSASASNGAMLVLRTSASSSSTGSAVSYLSTGEISYTIPNNVSDKPYLQLSLYANYNGTWSTNCYVEYTNLIVTIDDEDTTYQPYTGASYPINLPVENLVDLKGIGTQTSNGITITDNNDGTYILNGTATANIVFSKNISTPLPIGTYTYAMNNSSVVGTNASSSVYCYLLATETGTNWLFDRYSYQATNSSVTTTTTQSYTLNTFRIVIPNGIVLNNLTIGYQIEKGSKKNSFTSYGTTPIELCKIEDYRDYFYKENDKWYVYKTIDEAVLDGTETWYLWSASLTNTERFYTNVDGYNFEYALCEQLRYMNGNQDEEHYRYSTSGGSNKQFVVFVNKDRLSAITTTGMKNWVQNNNIEIYARLENPTSTEITDATLIEQLNAIDNAYSYKDQTNISQENNDLPFILDVDAFKNTTSGKIAGLSEEISDLKGIDTSILNAKEDKSNKVTSLSSASTDTQYPSAKCVYDIIGDVETLLTTLDVGNGVA